MVNVSTILIELPSIKPPPSGCKSLSSWNVQPSSLACRQCGDKAMSKRVQPEDQLIKETPKYFNFLPVACWRRPWCLTWLKRWLHLCEIHLNTTMNTDARNVMSEPPVFLPYGFLYLDRALQLNRRIIENNTDQSWGSCFIILHHSASFSIIQHHSASFSIIQHH